VRYQTHFATLLGKRLPKYARIDWEQLSREIGVSDRTLRTWYEAQVGSKFYLSDYRRTTADKIMDFLGLEDINDLVVRVDGNVPMTAQERNVLIRA